MPSSQPQRVRDPLHGLIEFEDSQFESELWRLICTRPFQRLRRIKQLGFSDMVYPGATHSRFAHSVGVFHTARMLMKKIEAFAANKFNDTHSKHALAAALLHDLGHGPFSHAFENVAKHFDLKSATHEDVTIELLHDEEISKILNKMFGAGYIENIRKKVMGIGDLYSAVVSSQFDADRLDYMRRDLLMTGTKHAHIDFEWLLDNLEVGEVETGTDEAAGEPIETFVLGKKAVFAAEAYVLSLFHLYPTVYFHKTTRGAEVLFKNLISEVFETVRGKKGDTEKPTGLSKKHPLIQYIRSDGALGHLLDLDDSVILGSLPLMRAANNPKISEYAQRLLDRNLFKCIDVRKEIEGILHDWLAAKGSGAVIRSAEIDKISASVKEKIEEAGDLDVIVDEGQRNPYQKFDESKGPLNQIRIRVEGGVSNLEDLGERSKVVAGLDIFRFFRIYFDRTDAATENRVRILIRQTANDATGGGTDDQKPQ